MIDLFLFYLFYKFGKCTVVYVNGYSAGEQITDTAHYDRSTIDVWTET